MRRKRHVPEASRSRRQCAAFLAVAVLSLSCERSSDGEFQQGNLRIRFSESVRSVTRGIDGLPDTNDFILEVRNSSGEPVYSGAFGDSPEVMSLPSGSYDVSIRSIEFSSPAFSAPLFGDDRCVVVPAGGEVSVSLECLQLNSGVMLRISPDFLTACPQGVLFLSSDRGRLMYGYSERRAAYFMPGNVSLVLSEAGTDRTLFTRRLEAREMLVVSVQVAEGAGAEESGISVSLDTTRIWSSEDYVIGGSSSAGEEAGEALSVAQAMDMVGAEDVWVTGYVVGGDLSRTSVSFSPPFESPTNLAIAARSSVTSKESCISVELPSGAVRDALNLPSHPELIGRRVCLKGDIVESYFGITGLKKVSEYELK